MNETSLDDVYRKFGEVSEAAQLLETELGTLLLESHAPELGLLQGDARPEAAAILRKINASTLGNLLKRLEAREPNLAPAVEAMANALAERNRLSHTFFRQHNFRRNSAEGRTVMLDDLEAIHSTLLGAYKLALALSGIDLDGHPPIAPPTRHLKLE